MSFDIFLWTLYSYNEENTSVNEIELSIYLSFSFSVAKVMFIKEQFIFHYWHGFPCWKNTSWVSSVYSLWLESQVKMKRVKILRRSHCNCRLQMPWSCGSHSIIVVIWWIWSRKVISKLTTESILTYL